MTEEAMVCPEPESQLLPFLAAGTLSAAERRSVLSHVGACERCREELRDTEKLTLGLRTLHLTPDEVVAAAAGGARPTHLDLCPACQGEVTIVQRSHAELAGPAAAAAPPKPWWRPLAKSLASARAGYATAATLLLVSAILNDRIVVLEEDNQRLTVQLRESQAPPGSAPTPTPPVSASTELLQGPVAASQPQVSAPLANIEKPPVELAAARALVLRGSRAGDSFLEAFGEAIEPYRAGNYAAAAGRLHAVGERYPDAAEPPYYEGVSLLFLGRPKEATLALTRARRASDASFATRVSWYAAIAYERAGRHDEARRELEGLCRGKSPYTGQACDALKASATAR